MSLDEGVQRVLRDVYETAGLSLSVEWVEDEIWVWRRRPWRRRKFVMSMTVGQEVGAAWLAEFLQDQVVIEALGEAWPRCIEHGRHPMRAVEGSDGRGWWVCPYVDAHRLPIGSLQRSSVSEPPVADDHVRWFMDHLGVGVVAHSDGDVWVHFSVIEGAGERTLVEDELVDWEANEYPDRRGFTRRATMVRRRG